MRLPWQNRVDRAHDDRVSAERQLAEVRQDGPTFEVAMEFTREQRELNNFTNTIDYIFRSSDTGGKRS